LSPPDLLRLMVWHRTNPRDFGKDNEAGGGFRGEGSSAGRTASHLPGYRQDTTSLPIALDGSVSEDPKLKGVSKSCEVEEVSPAELASDPPDAECFLFFVMPHFLYWRRYW
jgi:hypothetical protein